MQDHPLNPMAAASLACGILAIVGHCGCCIPIISYIAPCVVILFEILALVLGFLSRQRADGSTDGLAMAGIGAGLVAVLMSVAYTLLAVVAGVGFVGMSVLSEM